jgi:hypothetical protein
METNPGGGIASSMTGVSEGVDTTIESDEYEIQGPLIFSCASCKTILGDSFALTSTHAELRTVSLSGVNHIQLRDDDLMTSRGLNAVDKGSTYYYLHCTTCDQIVGKYYISTPRILDHIREQYTLLTEKISSYELGRVMVGVPGERQQGFGPPAVPPPPPPPPGTVPEAAVSELEEEVSKVNFDSLYSLFALL